MKKNLISTGQPQKIRNKKRFGQVKNKNFSQFRKKDLAVVFDEKERKDFLTGVFGAKNRRKKHNEKIQEIQEKIEKQNLNKKRRNRKKNTLEKFKKIIEEKDTFFQNINKDKIKSSVEEMITKNNNKVIVKTSFITD